MRLLPAIVVALPCFTPLGLFAADPAMLTQLVVSAAANYQAREALPLDFTYTESFRNMNFSSAGKKTLDVSDTFEVIFLEGAPYSRHLTHDNQSLSQREERKEQRAMDDVAKARRAGNHKAGFYPHALTFKLPIAELATNFNLTDRGEEMVNHRTAFVIDAFPSTKAPPDAKESELAAALHMTVWVDQRDIQVSKVHAELIKEAGHYHPGAIIDVEYQKVHDEIWLLSGFRFRGDVSDGSHTVVAEAEESRNNYRKFSSESKVIVQ